MKHTNYDDERTECIWYCFKLFIKTIAILTAIFTAAYYVIQ